MAALLGAAGALPPAAVAATLASVLAVNATAHVAVLHVLLGAALSSVGLPPPRVPAWLARRLGSAGGGV